MASTWRGFALDSESHDLAFDDTGDLASVEGDEATAQEIKTRLLFFKGEGFTDLREGVPYFQEILRKGVDLDRVRAIVRQVVASHPAIRDVPVVSVDLDRATRACSVSFEARTREGRTIRSEDFGPLVIE